MTGFGEGSAERSDLRAHAEVKGTNHRFLDIKMRLPTEMGLLEPALRSAAQERLTRGRVDIVVTITTSDPGLPRPTLDRDTVAGYLEAAETLRKEFHVRGELDVETVLSLPGSVSRQGTLVPSAERAAPVLLDALRAALDVYDDTRAAEGARLTEDIQARLLEIGTVVRRIETEARGLPEAYARRIREKVAALHMGSSGPDESRLAQEVALLATRMDITEELVRLNGYLVQAGSLLSPARGPVGKTLDFIMQEMNREANTISSKADVLAICQGALAIKAEVEKIREQAQNLE